MARLNCWDAMRCERGPGGKKVHERGLCPAASAEAVDGVHGGINGGRACWAIAGTFCGGKVCGDFTEKQSTCLKCDFFRLVQQEEDSLIAPVHIAARLQHQRA